MVDGYQQKDDAGIAACLKHFADVYKRQEKYLRGAEQQIAVLELFDGQQPDYHLHETAIFLL